MKKLTIEQTSNGFIVKQEEPGARELSTYIFRSLDDFLMLVHIAKFMCKRNVKIEEK